MDQIFKECPAPAEALQKENEQLNLQLREADDTWTRDDTGTVFPACFQVQSSIEF